MGKEDKQPQYLPLIVKAKLHTGGRDYEKIKEELKGQGFTCKQMRGGQHRPRSSQKAGGSSRRRPVPEEKKTAPATQAGKQGQQIP